RARGAPAGRDLLQPAHVGASARRRNSRLRRQSRRVRAARRRPLDTAVPFGLVLLPTELVPLHIFEERYRLMIGECLDTDNEFGIVWLSDNGLKDVGC